MTHFRPGLRCPDAVNGRQWQPAATRGVRILAWRCLQPRVCDQQLLEADSRQLATCTRWTITCCVFDLSPRGSRMARKSRMS